MHEENFAEGKHYCIAEMMLKQGVTLAVGGNCGVMNQTVREFRDTIDELGGSPIPGILQARTLEWFAISFSNA